MASPPRGKQAKFAPNAHRAEATRAISGGIDLSLSDPLVAGCEPLDPARAAQAAEYEGFGGILINDHCEPTTPSVAFLKSRGFNSGRISILSGIVLNDEVGGINPFAVEHCLMLGGRLIAMPTRSAGHYRRRFRRALMRSGANDTLPRRSLTVVDERMRPTADATETLDLIARHDAVLDAGYLHLSEILPLFAEAKRRGVKRFVVGDPDRYAEAQPDEIRALAEFGAMIGFSLDLPPSPMERIAAFRDVPTESIIVHLGFHEGRDVDARLRRADAFIEYAAAYGLGWSDIRQMMGENGARLVGC